MEEKHRPKFHAIMQRIAASGPGTWLFAITARHVDSFFLKISRNRTTLSNLLTGLPIVLLTTTGARSKLPRSIPLAYVRHPTDPASIAIIASNFGSQHHPAWYFNLKAYPQAVGSIDGEAKRYTAREAESEEYSLIWQKAVEIYMGFTAYEKRARPRAIPIMVLSDASMPSPYDNPNT